MLGEYGRREFSVGQIVHHVHVLWKVEVRQRMELRIPQLKVAVVGTHGTGKTTLCTELGQRLRSQGLSVTELEEVPRRICLQQHDSNFFKRSNNNVLRQLTLLVAQLIEEEFAMQKPTRVVICDRSLLDHWAYSLQLFRSDLVAAGVDEVVQSKVAKHCLTYNLVLYLPPEIDFNGDDVRENDTEFRSHVDDRLKSLLESLSINYHTISGTLDDRAASSLKLVQSLPEIKHM